MMISGCDLKEIIKAKGLAIVSYVKELPLLSIWQNYSCNVCGSQDAEFQSIVFLSGTGGS